MTHYVVLADHRSPRGQSTTAEHYDNEHDAWYAAIEFERGEFSGFDNPRIIVVEGNTARVIPNSEIAGEALHRERMSCERQTPWALGY